jgi:hypothetical protein
MPLGPDMPLGDASGALPVMPLEPEAPVDGELGATPEVLEP